MKSIITSLDPILRVRLVSGRGLRRNLVGLSTQHAGAFFRVADIPSQCRCNYTSSTSVSLAVSSSTKYRRRKKGENIKQTKQSEILKEHDEKVKALQAKLLQQNQHSEIIKKQQEMIQNQLVLKEEYDTIIQTINQWLKKDINFFTSTMEALNIPLLVQQQQQQQEEGHNRTNRQFQYKNNHKNNNDDDDNNTSKTTAMFLSGNHPIQVVWDQYRQLYYDTIPEFIQEQLSDQDYDNNPLKKHNILHELRNIGFGNIQWNREYKSVRTYQMLQAGLLQNVAKQQVEVQRRKQAFQKATAELKDMEEMNRLLTNSSNDGGGSYYSSTRTGKGKRRRPLRRKVQEMESSLKFEKFQNTAAPSKTDTTNEKESSPPTMFQKAWAALSSIWGESPSPSRTDPVEEPAATMPAATTSTITETDRAQDPSASNKPTQLQKRIKRKQIAVDDLKKQLDRIVTKLKESESKKETMQRPLSSDEYERAQSIVVKCRDIICSEFARHMHEKHAHLIAQYQTLDAKTDLTKPHEWYPYARLDRRKIIFHGGPTNSGKTYTALQRLKEAKRGLYLGPLRLLAAEIYETLTAEGIYTNLYTGQEKREIAFSTHKAATVEMCDENEEFDAVVLDEIQMLADPTRGAAWTKALLGVRCKEIHVCGGLEAKDIVEKIAGVCGDEFELNTYERFTELQIAKRALATNPKKTGAYARVQPGDCVVAFSRNDIFAIKREIEGTTQYKCCVIYGKLPPQARAAQARLFNDPDSGYDILVASDAIGMGLNLNIKRIIFNSIFKFNGDQIVRLNHSEIKQISGRAGRRNSPYPIGEVSCRDPRDLQYIRECLSTDIQPVEKAGLLPTPAHIEVFSEGMRAYDTGDDAADDLHQVLQQFNAMATVKGDFFLGKQSEMRMIAKRLKDIPLSIRDAYTICLSPASSQSLVVLENFAWKLSRGEVSGLPSRFVPKAAKSFDDLSHLCTIYSDCDLFLWLQLKFPPANAVEQATAASRKEKALEYINRALASAEHLKLNHCYVKTATRLRKSWESQHGTSTGLSLELEDGNGMEESDFDDDDEEDDDDYFLEENREAAY